MVWGQRVQARSNKQYSHHDVLPLAILEVVKPIWIRLSSKELLLRCARQATQNAHESFNGNVWHLCPKEGFCGIRTVEAAAALAVIKFKHGSKMFDRVLTRVGCLSGFCTQRGLAKEDGQRLYHARRKATAKEKKSRKRRRKQRKGVEDRLVEEEGETYAAGAF